MSQPSPTAPPPLRPVPPSLVPALLLVVAAGACGGGGDRGAPAEAAPPTAAATQQAAPLDTPPPVAPAAPTDSETAAPAAPFAGTTGVMERRAPGAPATLAAVSTASHAGYDRVVFRFADRLPGYRIEYLSGAAHACGSGAPVTVAGMGRLQIRLAPAQAHDTAGQPTVTERRRSPGLPGVEALVLTCDFEADVTWVLGVASATGYRVLELSGPPRLAVDVLHPTRR